MKLVLLTKKHTLHLSIALFAAGISLDSSNAYAWWGKTGSGESSPEVLSAWTSPNSSLVSSERNSESQPTVDLNQAGFFEGNVAFMEAFRNALDSKLAGPSKRLNSSGSLSGWESIGGSNRGSRPSSVNSSFSFSDWEDVKKSGKLSQPASANSSLSMNEWEEMPNEKKSDPSADLTDSAASEDWTEVDESDSPGQEAQVLSGSVKEMDTSEILKDGSPQSDHYPDCQTSPVEGITQPKGNLAQHSPVGKLDYQAVRDKEGAALIQVKMPTYYSKVNVKKPLFHEPPMASQIYQDTSLDCGLLAPIASILAFYGWEVIENMVFDDIANGKVYVRLYDLKTNLPIIVEMDKVRDRNGSYTHAKYTSRSKLWLHMIERAYDAAFNNKLPVSKSSEGVYSGDAFRAILGDSENRIQFFDLVGIPQRAWLEDSKSGSKVREDLINKPAVLSRSNFINQSDFPGKSGIFSGHYYSVVSPVCVKDGQRGMWIFNTLNRDNSYLGYVRSSKYSRLFFLSLPEIPQVFTRGDVVQP